MNKKNNRKGFTIVELVIVIAVIAILATVLVPTFGNVIADANNVKLVRQIQTAQSNYATKYAATENYHDDLYIKIDNKFYQFENGAVKVNGKEAVEVTLPTDADSYYYDAAKAVLVFNHNYAATSNDNPACKNCDDAQHTAGYKPVEIAAN